jgi:FKBP-type peptidyl-prolyl cis-trans isomerase SlyD
MQIEDKMAVSIHYTLKDNAGEIIDSSQGDEPLVYLHGTGGLGPGLEKELTSKAVGDAFDVTIAPEDGYGVRDDSLVQEVPRDAFQDVKDLEVGMQFHTQAPDGEGILPVTITALKDEEVTIDLNHPLAGETLNFHIEVIDIRAATKDELAHGHVHGAGCQH